MGLARGCDGYGLGSSRIESKVTRTCDLYLTRTIFLAAISCENTYLAFLSPKPSVMALVRILKQLSDSWNLASHLLTNIP